MSFKTIDMTKLGLDVVARLKSKIRSEFVAECKEEGFEFDVEVGPDGCGSLFVEFYDLMDGFIGTEAKKTLERVVYMDPNTDVINSGHTRPGYRDFRHGAMPCVYVEFKLIP
jgi:hypothetical protein